MSPRKTKRAAGASRRKGGAAVVVLDCCEAESARCHPCACECVAARLKALESVARAARALRLMSRPLDLSPRMFLHPMYHRLNISRGGDTEAALHLALACLARVSRRTDGGRE